MEFAAVLTVVALTLLGLGGGTFWSFSTGVMPGLARADDDTFVGSMRAINRAVLNPLFLLPIFLAPLLLAWAGILQLPGASGVLLVASAVVAFVGMVVVTMAGNVPLNTALDASTASPSAARAAFERRWNRLNAIRSLAAVASIALGASALVV